MPFMLALELKMI